MTLQHIVLFSFPSALSAEDEAELRAMVASWPRGIGLMTQCPLGSEITRGPPPRVLAPALYRIPRLRRDDRLPRSSGAPGLPGVARQARLRPACLRLRPGRPDRPHARVTPT